MESQTNVQADRSAWSLGSEHLVAPRSRAPQPERDERPKSGWVWDSPWVRTQVHAPREASRR